MVDVKSDVEHEAHTRNNPGRSHVCHAPQYITCRVLARTVLHLHHLRQRFTLHSIFSFHFGVGVADDVAGTFVNVCFALSFAQLDTVVFPLSLMAGWVWLWGRGGTMSSLTQQLYSSKVGASSDRSDARHQLRLAVSGIGP